MRRAFGSTFRRRRPDGSYLRHWYCRWTEPAPEGPVSPSPNPKEGAAPPTASPQPAGAHRAPRARRRLRVAGLTRASAEQLLDAIEAEQRLALELARGAALPAADVAGGDGGEEVVAADSRGHDGAGPSTTPRGGTSPAEDVAAAVRREAARARSLAGVAPAVLNAWAAILAPGTMRNRRATLARWAARLGPGPVSAITAADIQAAVRTMRGQGLAASTVATEVGILSAAFRTMARELRLRLPPNPCHRDQGLTLPAVHANPRPHLPAAAVESFIRACPSNIRPQVVLLADAGLRPGEVLGLLWGEVSLDLRALLLRNTKTHRGRTVPLTDRAVEVLAAARTELLLQPSPSSPVFTLPERRFRDLFRKAARAERLPRLVLYSFRHGLASGLLQEGAPISVVRDLLGHSNVRTTDVYLRSLPDDAGRQAVEDLGRARASASVRPPSL